MYKLKKFISYMIICVLVFSLSACAKQSKSNRNQELYGETVGGLEDDELFAIIETNASAPVLLVSSSVYDDGLGNQAALVCDVYYVVDNEVQKTGTIQSFGTAYPISYDKTGIYAASGHDIQRFGIQEDGTIKLEEGMSEVFDENGNPTYVRDTGNHTEAATEEAYLSELEKYGESTIVNFGYGASGKTEQ